MLGWGIVGIGRLADIALAPAIARQPDSRLVAVCSRDPGRAQRFAQRHGAERAYHDYARMIADPDVDIVSIATPNGLHRQHAIAALQAGKHVLVEKPMTLSLAEGREMLSAATAAGRLLAVGFHLRHKQTNRAARSLLTQQRLGPMRFAELCVGAGKDRYPYDTWRAEPTLAGGGTLLHQGTHALDLLSYLTGRPVVEVTCITDAEDLEDVMVATCVLEDGLLATVSSHQLRGGTPRDWRVVGEHAWLEGRGALAATAGDELIAHTNDGAQVVASSPASAYDDEIDAFAAAVRGAAPLNGDGWDGMRNIAVVEALYRSARERRSVVLDGPWGVRRREIPDPPVV
jgi:1,5-anhydro-D-fructose reductase (1,5-anhydro-D-mannitol-forming)